uniref:Tc1-like transposase DDE domain-containing protein n=1 Tax=Caenorhabditis japonica TaxID=281687 RepID=A0A8R1IFY0_CAEJA
MKAIVAEEIGVKVLGISMSDLPKHATIKSKIAHRGEDLASNVRDGIATIAAKLGSSAKGTIFGNVDLLTATLLGVSKRSVAVRAERLIRPEKAREGWQRPTRKELRKRAAEKISSDDKKKIHTFLQSVWIQKKDVRLKEMLEWAKKNIDFPYGQRVLTYVLGGMGFCFKKKTHNPNIEEREDLRAMRIKFLEKMQRLREAGSYFCYFDETWIFAGMVLEYGWQVREADPYKRAREIDKKERLPGPPKGASRGKRGIVAAVLTMDGVLPGSEKVWVSNVRASERREDYHQEMNAELYEKYMLNDVIPALVRVAAAANQPPVLIIDNAPYHNRTLENAPTKAAKKQVMKDFLTRHGALYDESAKRAELYEKVEELIASKGGRWYFKKYVVDEFAKSKGVIVHVSPLSLQKLEERKAQRRAKAEGDALRATAAAVEQSVMEEIEDEENRLEEAVADQVRIFKSEYGYLEDGYEWSGDYDEQVALFEDADDQAFDNEDEADAFAEYELMRAKERDNDESDAEE